MPKNISVVFKTAIVMLLALLTVNTMAIAAELSDELKMLKTASAFTRGGGERAAAEVDEYDAYKKICTNWNKLGESDLNDLLESATPAGKLYAAALIWETNCYRGQPAMMKSGFESLKNDKAKVKYQSGCDVSEHTVGEIASAFLKDGQWLDFGVSRWCEKPVRESHSLNDLKLLESAKVFSYGEVLGQATKNEQYAAYQRILAGWNKLAPNDLDNMLKAATPAGKLYAAALISEVNCYGGHPTKMKTGFEQLKRDSTKVMYRSGCCVSEHTVGEIASAFLKDGKFQDFGVSVFCKKPVSGK